MKAIISCCTLLFALVANAQKDHPKYSAEIEKRITRIINDLSMKTDMADSSITRTLEQQMEKYHTPGVSIAVINNGKIEWMRGFGNADISENKRVDTNTLFQAGSISKPTTAMAIMKLCQEKKLHLDTNVNTYLKSWKIPQVGGWQPAISLRQILSHTAGLTVHGFPGYERGRKIPTVVQVLKGAEPANTARVHVNILPGTRFRYSGGGTTIAQLVLMDQLSPDFPGLMRKELFDKVGMSHSSFEQAPSPFAATAYPYQNVPLKGKSHIYPEMAPAGLWTTPGDLARMLIEVQKGLKGKSDYISAATAEEMLTPQPVAPFIGIGFFLEGDSTNKRFEHNGWDEGFVAKAVAYKERDFGAVVMINSNEGNEMLVEITDAIAREYQWPGYLKPGRQYTVPAQIDSIAGNYVSDKEIKINIQYQNGKLWLKQVDQYPIELLLTENNTFRNRLMNFAVRFGQDEMTIEQEGQQIIFKRK